MHKIIFTGLLFFSVVSYGEVFKCVLDGAITFQGRPCQHGVGEKVELDISPAVKVVKAPTLHSLRDKKRPASKSKPNSSKTKKQKQAVKRRCERAKARYKRHLSVMRAGYSHKKSNRMGEKARFLKAEINKRCS